MCFSSTFEATPASSRLECVDCIECSRVSVVKSCRRKACCGKWQTLKARGQCRGFGHGSIRSISTRITDAPSRAPGSGMTMMMFNRAYRLISRSAHFPSNIVNARMSSQAQSASKLFFVYAPDKTDEGTFENRMTVRPKHLETAKERTAQGLIRRFLLALTSISIIEPCTTGLGGGLMTPESIATPDAPKKLVGSTFIFQAESLEE